MAMDGPMRIPLRARLYGGFAILAVLVAVMGSFSYRQTGQLDDLFTQKAHLEQAARELYTLNGLTERFAAQSLKYRTTQTAELASGMQASLSEVSQLADGLMKRALSDERRALTPTCARGRTASPRNCRNSSRSACRSATTRPASTPRATT